MKATFMIGFLLSATLGVQAAPAQAYHATKFTTTRYHLTFDAVPVGTVLKDHMGLKYSGFIVATAENGIQPYPTPRAAKNKRFAVANSARAATVNSLPTLRADKKGGKFILNSFWWAASPYFGRNVTLSIMGYDESTNGDGLTYSGQSLQFVYNTGYNVGANGAQLQEAVMPNNFLYAAYKFNITDPVEAGGAIPTLYLDEFRQVSVVPS